MRGVINYQVSSSTSIAQQYTSIRLLFTSRSARSARTAGTKIDLRFPRLFVCLFVRPHLSRAQNITSYVTMQLQCIAAFGSLRAKLQQMKVVLCCLDDENVVGSRKDPILVAYSYYLEAHDETAESALSLYRSRNNYSISGSTAVVQ